MPMISVIVPVYKVERYIHRCVESILEQTFSDFELILVDDGSPDKCPEICDYYTLRDERVKVIHQKNTGVSRARNAGLDIAQGKYIAFCDSDDYFDLTMLEETLCEMINKKVDCVSCNYRRMEDNAVPKEIKYADGIYLFPTWEEKITFFLETFLQCNVGWEVWSRLFRKDIIDEYQIRFCESCDNFAEDLGFCAKYYLCSTSFQMMKGCYYNYCVREKSMMISSKNIVKVQQLNEVSYDIWKFAKIHMPKDEFNTKIDIIHLMTMNNQFHKLLNNGDCRLLPAELQKIKKALWFKKRAWGLIKNWKVVKQYFGNYRCAMAVIFSLFCIHRNCYVYMAMKRCIHLYIKAKY